jgi:uncharacterized cupin superfamily protein
VTVVPKIDIDELPVDSRPGYPPPHDRLVGGCSRKRLGHAAGLDQFDVNLATLAPGSASALRHWHNLEDEFVYVLDGELVLIEDEGETVIRSGDAAAFKAGVANGHHLVNRSRRKVVYLEIGSRRPGEIVHYVDVDLALTATDTGARFTRKDGSPV